MDQQKDQQNANKAGATPAQKPQQGQGSHAGAQQGTAKPQQGQAMPGGKPAAADTAKRQDTSVRPAQTDRPGSGSGSGSGASPSQGSNRSSDDIDV
jgi:hypothetical protein